MKTRYIDFWYFFWGLFFSVMVVFGVATGKVISLPDHDIRFAIILYRKINPILYFAWTFAYGLLGIVLLYRSLLFIPSNRDHLEEEEGFNRKIVGLEREDESVDWLRVLMGTILTILIFVSLYYIFIGL